ncbi:hypothetical protein ONE63_009395 [Megalurothrips usitatus]|uniref:Uncharacterized protein n=1 Tax=Megalurothrips usitatus TaxID=439358 RepID=A0AAV7XJH9_9NEOP|nr:hypothetical protein ONE63_009395 [Megalurothrips usitatus]
MEKGKCTQDPLEEVRKLQEKVRELELQLSQKTTARNGISDAPSKPVEIDEIEDEGLVPVFDVDLNIKTWLVDSRVDSQSEQEIFAALVRDIVQEKALYAAICNAEQDRRKNIDSRTFTRPKKRTGRPSLELFESLSGLSKPVESKLPWALEGNGAELDNMTCSLLESSLINSVYGPDTSTCDLTSQLSIVNKKQKVTSQLGRRRGSLIISDKIEISTDGLLSSQKHDNGNSLASPFESVSCSNSNDLAEKNDVVSSEIMLQDVNAALLESSDFSTSLIDSTLMDANLMDTIIVHPKPMLNNSRVPQLNRTYTPSPPPTGLTSLRKGSNDSLGHNQSLENLNQTFVKEDDESPNHFPVLNDTFALESNGSSGPKRYFPPVPRPGSTDSGGGDDDQLSSTSESSHTSATRLMSVGDVQHIARLQEESLVMSTPAHRHLTRMMDYCEENISPITGGPDCGRSSGSSEVQTAGYCSDHSSRSPLSSLHSSPAGSPFGSSTMLPGSNQTHDNKLAYRPNGLLQRKNTYGLLPPTKVKERGLRPPAPVTVPPMASARTGRPTARSGLRPPMIRTSTAGSSALPRPAGTGIPRPSSLSRIPPPKVRSTISQPSRKEWTDECY